MSQIIPQKQIYIIKANGQSVPFDRTKVVDTCIRAGASKYFAEEIAEKIHKKVRKGMRTREIYRMVLNALAEAEEGKTVKHRYRLKESIMQMGPAGFAFETYVGKVLENYGYDIQATRIKVKGRCVEHEIDLVARVNLTNEKYLIECKYHNLPGIYTGLKESLYTHARYLDLSDDFNSEMLVCNTKVSDDVITYANCIDQKLLCWRYPPSKGLESMIEPKGLYPITILGLKRKELEAFSKNKIMLVKDLLTADTSQLSHITNIPHNRLQRLKDIVKQIIES
jgi:hypothetical protein